MLTLVFISKFPPFNLKHLIFLCLPKRMVLPFIIKTKEIKKKY